MRERVRVGPSALGAWLAVLALAVPAVAVGQGFSINEHSACAMARGNAGVAAPCGDGSALFLSPAGLVGREGWTVSGGVTAIALEGDFSADLTGESTPLDVPVVPAPHGYLTYGLSERLAVGVGVAVPYGLETGWPLDFAGRFIGYDNSLRAFYIQPTVAWRPHERIAVGAGFDFVVGSVELTRRLDLAEQRFLVPGFGSVTAGQLGVPARTDFGNAAVSADGARGVGGNFGVRVKLTDWLDFGARYLTQVKLDFDGDAVFEPVSTGLVLPPQNPISLTLPTLDPSQPLPVDPFLEGLGLFDPDGPLADQRVSTEITLPDQLTLGLALRPRRDLTLLLDWVWMDWSDFDVQLDFERWSTLDRTLVQNFEDTQGVRVGADWSPGPRWRLRGGYIIHGAAEPDESVTPLLPEAGRSEVTLGAGYRFGGGLRADLGYMFLRQDRRRGRVQGPDQDEPPTSDLNSGLYEFSAHLVAAMVSIYE